MIPGYSVDMELLPALRPGALTVVCAPHAAREPVSRLTAELALQGSVTVLDGGNRFQPYRVAQFLRQKTPDVNQVSKRIFIRRAFTCYQMLALLENTPSLRQPYIILDLLATFYDDHVPTHEARRLLDGCLCQVERLGQFAPVVVTLAPPPASGHAFLAEMVCARADRLLMPEVPAPAETQLPLFTDHCSLMTGN